ncbi:bifunctional riboflavin kinase/FAD synthetase [Bacillus sp. PS06]|uniref:bifunctional riboflavin kinase/FAD synthetase n=1 Tax=Bacillus sp. PS06 TaxID=2764176 RepID=UPI00177E0B46|nr:bifunctional riboflavin kinase/FAD synthetase [Bacillus sp. PS06]MBD8070741.1 bifunctional riboflavin kinase/FAD synthetase [Bacillus sp. PS06]
MEIINVTTKPPHDLTSLVLVIGKLDGIHKGHQLLLHEAKEYIQEDDMLAVWSFSKHPQYVLNEDPEFEHDLTPLKDKVSILKEYGVQRLYHVEFTKEYAKIPADEFVLEHLSQLNVKRLIVGEDFRFGAGGRAGTDELIRLCEKINIQVSVIPFFRENGMKISSTDIRSLISNGKVEAAQVLLNRRYRVIGEVIHGNALGRELGFPTINLGKLESYVLPKPGVYVGTAEIYEEGMVRESWACLISAGYRPTVNGEGYLIEAHLLNYSGDLYGKTVAVSFIRYLRGEIKFDGLESLIHQMQQDKKEAEEILGFIE